MAPLPRGKMRENVEAELTTVTDSIQSTIVLKKSTTGLGLEVVGGADTYLDGVVISMCEPNGVAKRDGRLSVGDQILAVNGVSLINKSHKEAVSTLRIATSPVRLTVLRENPEKIFTTTDSPTMFLDVQISKPISEYLGLSILARKDKRGVFVTYVTENSLAYKDGIIEQGDRILEVNGEDLRNTTQEQASLVLRHCFGKVKIKVGRIPSLLKSIKGEGGRSGYVNYAIEEEKVENPKILRRTSSYSFEKYRISRTSSKDVNRNLAPGKNRNRSRSNEYEQGYARDLGRAYSFQEPKRQWPRQTNKQPAVSSEKFRYISPDRIEFTLSDNEDIV